MNEINHYFYLKDLDAENTGGCSDFFFLPSAYQRAVIGVRWNVFGLNFSSALYSSNWFGSQPYPLTGKKQTFFPLEIHEGSLFIGK